MNEDKIDPKFKEKSAKEFEDSIESGELYDELNPDEKNNKQESQIKKKKTN